MEIKVWDIIRADVPNTENHKISKERPVLLVKIDDNGESDTFLKISSVPHNDFKQVPIEDMRGSSLNKISYINMDTAYTLNRTNFPKNRPRGHLSIHDIANVSKEIIKSGMDINNPVDLNDSINPIAKALGKDYKNIPLEDDETETGGIAFAGETLGDFIDEVGGIGEFASLEELNSALVSNGIKPVGKVKKESIKKPAKKHIKIKNYPMLSKGGENIIAEDKEEPEKSLTDFINSGDFHTVLTDDARDFDIHEWEKRVEEDDDSDSDSLVEETTTTEKFAVSKEDVQEVLDKIATSDIFVANYYKTRGFMRANNITTEDIKEIARNLTLSDYSYSVKSKTFKPGDTITVFITNKEFSVNGKVIGGSVLYIEIDKDYGDPVAIVSMHNTNRLKKNPYKEALEDNSAEKTDFNSLKKRISKFIPNVSVSNSNSKEMFELHDDISNNKNLTREEKRKLTDMLLDRLEDKKEESLKEDLENPSEDMPEPGIDTGIADQLITLINGEWDTIKDYNSFIATIADLDTFQEATDVIKDIVNEEHLHVGQLQALLQKVSPNTSSIAKGEEEGREQIEEA